MENTSDLRKKEYGELKAQYMSKKKEVAENVMNIKLGKTVNFRKKQVKKEIARIKTILREKELLNAK